MCMHGTASPNMDRAEYEESLKVFFINPNEVLQESKTEKP